MRYSLSMAFIGLCLFAVGCTSKTFDHTETVTDVQELIQAQLTGELALETTAYVEQFWRVVGNAGFDSSIYKIVEQLELAGYVLEDAATANERLTYRLEKRPLERPTWEPVNASLYIDGSSAPLLEYSSNRNMIAMYSHSTGAEGVTAEVVRVKDLDELERLNVQGKIVYMEAAPRSIYDRVVLEGGAIGLLTYNNPDYLEPAKNTTSIQFRRIPYNEEIKAWCIPLSYAANETLKSRLNQEKVIITANIETKIYESEELTVVADIRGSNKPDERMVFSAHVQEPGANDNASGVGAQVEMAAVSAGLVKNGDFDPSRTLTFLWGDEIVSTRRYVQEDEARASGVIWGISLDMVGENTAVTGGSFLIEKMPDPSAIWTRGDDEHTEWGGSEMTLEEMQPHYLNDLAFGYAMNQSRRANWPVKTNPYEGGSDHVPFLRADIPSVLFWHFTDQYYHTDNDRIDKVSKTTLKNVAIVALSLAATLVNADVSTAATILEEVKQAGMARLKEELKQSEMAIAAGSTKEVETQILQAWGNWYIESLATVVDLVDDQNQIMDQISSAQADIAEKVASCIGQL
ncbi:MAG: M28 family peptidase [Cyclobacteriaceae bacterium]